MCARVQVGVGFSLQPEEAFLDLLGDVIRREPDYFELAPETCWAPERDGEFGRNGFSKTFERLGRAGGQGFVAHGVGFSVGSAEPDTERRGRWLRAIARDHVCFDFGWYTDHLGVSVPAGHEILLPIALPYTPGSCPGGGGFPGGVAECGPARRGGELGVLFSPGGSTGRACVVGASPGGQGHTPFVGFAQRVYDGPQLWL